MGEEFHIEQILPAEWLVVLIQHFRSEVHL